MIGTAARVAGPLATALLSTAERAPERPFLLAADLPDVSQAGGVLTYGEAARRVEEAAEELRREAYPVVLAGTAGGRWVLALLAAQAAGRLTALLPAGDPAAERQERIAGLGELLGTTRVLSGDGEDGAGVLHHGPSQLPPLPESAALGLLTSGSSGRPRLALRSAESLLGEGERYRRLLALEPSDRLYAALPLAHAFCLGLALGGALAAGCCLEVEPRFSPRGVLRRLAGGDVTILPLVPSAARLLCTAAARRGADGPAEVRGLRHAVVGAGPLDDALEGDLRRLLGVRPARNYGSSESGATLGTAGEAVETGTTGRPLPGVEVALAGEVVPAGEAATGATGALFVRTAHPFLGYLTDDGLDASRCAPGGWYSTGDLVRRLGGGRQHGEGDYFQVVRRLGTSLRRGGRSVEPAEIEARLRTHPDIADCAVVGERDARGEETLHAHVELRPGGAAETAELRAHLEARLPSYKVPAAWTLHGALPRTAGGKPDRRRLAAGTAGTNSASGTFGSANSTATGATAEPGAAPWTALLTHRVSAAVTAAHRVGLLAALAAAPAGSGELAERCGLRPEPLAALLSLLAAAGVLRARTDGAWELVGAPADGDLVELEAHLRQHQLAPRDLAELLHGEAPDPWADTGFAARYLRLMGRPAQAAALLASRRLRRPAAARPTSPAAGRWLVVGRPAAPFADALRQGPSAPEAEALELPPSSTEPRSSNEQVRPPTGPWRAVALHNALRSLPRQGPLALASLAAELAPGGALVVSDLFLDGLSTAATRGLQATPWLPAALAVEWQRFAQHGPETGDELAHQLRELGLAGVERLPSSPPFELILAFRPT